MALFRWFIILLAETIGLWFFYHKNDYSNRTDGCRILGFFNLLF